MINPGCWTALTIKFTKENQMTNFVEVIKACEAANGAGTKKTIQEALAKADPIARKLITAAMNPYAVYGVRKYDAPTSFCKVDAPMQVVFSTLDQLATRQLTGKAAQEAVTGMLGAFTKETADYIARLIDKDLKAGFSADTFNKIWKDEKIPTFEVQLADKCEDTEDFEKYVTFPCLAEAKLDGERTIAVVEGDSVIYYSRSGKVAEHVNGLFDEDLLKIREELDHDFILDGERYASNFTETMNAKKSGNDEAKKNLKFYAYFIMSLADWKAQKTTMTMEAARAKIIGLIDKLALTKITRPVGRIVNDYHDMMEYCNSMIDEFKFEGLILKNLTSVYEWDRTYAWTKVKRFYDVDARIVGFYPGRPKSRLADTVGGVNCVGFLESGERVEFNVGSGFSDDQRADMKANPQKWLAATHVIKYQEVSRSKSKTVASLRFCTYEHARDDKVVEI